jgi:hypothetical protein
MCSAASCVLILVVIAESLTNALGCERSESESSLATATTYAVAISRSAAAEGITKSGFARKYFGSAFNPALVI